MQDHATVVRGIEQSLCASQQRTRPKCRNGSFTTDAFSTRADQCPLLLPLRHYCPAQRSDAKGRLCCKSRMLQVCEFFAKTRNGKQSPIRITSTALPKSPVSLR